MERRPPTGIARERETRTDDGAPYRREWRTPCSIRTAPLAPLRGAVPTRGRRSRACASLVLNRDCAVRPPAAGGADRRSASRARVILSRQEGVIRDLGDTRFRCASRSGADRRSAVPCQVSSFPGGVRAETGVIRELGDTRLRFAQRCRPEVGVCSSFPGGVRRDFIPDGRYAVSRPCGCLWGELSGWAFAKQ